MKEVTHTDQFRSACMTKASWLGLSCQHIDESGKYQVCTIMLMVLIAVWAPGREQVSPMNEPTKYMGHHSELIAVTALIPEDSSSREYT